MKTSAKLLTQVGLITLFTLILSTSCSLKVRKHQPKVSGHPSEDLAVTPNQIRLRMRSLVEPFAGEIEQSADQIVLRASDVSVKRAAINWKIEGVPAIRGALFQPDPFTAVLDTWVLIYQMTDYFEKGPGRTSMGDLTPVAVGTTRRMEDEFHQVVMNFTKSRDVSKVREAAKKWAMDHPIRYAIRDRETTLSRVSERDVGVDWTAGEVIAEMAITADDVHREIQIYSDHLFRQARWEAELLKLDLHTTEIFPLAERAVVSSEKAVTALDDLTPAIKTATGAAATAADAAKTAADTTAQLPMIIATERQAAVDAISEDLIRTLTFLQGERIAALKEISDERVETMTQLTVERVAVMKDVKEIAASERLALSQDIEQAGIKLVDHAVWRLAQLLAAVAAFLLLLFLILRLFHSPPESRHWAGRDMPRRV